MKITNQPPKGMYDWFPEEFAIRKYIFDTWREVCQKFGYKEYLSPMLEYAEVYRAKSGDAGGKELWTLFDRADRELAIRPEMTPSITRMVTQIYESSPKPLRLFSIANFLRNEKPQKGRNREFWQLNFDLFGSESINADIEILQIAVEIMLAFRPPKGSFIVSLNNRKLINYILFECVQINSDINSDIITEIVRIMDKYLKLTPNEFNTKLFELGLKSEQIESIRKFMECKDENDLKQNFKGIEENIGFQEVKTILNKMNELGYSELLRFNPSLIRGFDYYDGSIYEVFDTNPENPKALFGGGRYNGLAGIFGSKSFPAAGMAPGDETTRLFLEGWGLLERIQKENSELVYYLPTLSEKTAKDSLQLARLLRQEGKIVEQGLEIQNITKALQYANRKNLDFVVILGEDEASAGNYKVKDLKTGEESTLGLLA